MGNGNQLWIVGDPHRTLTPLIDAQYPAVNNDERFRTFAASFSTTLDVHLVHIYWGIAEWR
jgi:predicted aconitase